MRRILARSMDLVVSGVVLVLLAPLLVVVAVLVIADSPGPILSRQDRVGRRGRKFRLLAFRTTTNGSETTRIGHMLRRYALDELPLLWNVFVGDLDLVTLWRTTQAMSRAAGAQ